MIVLAYLLLALLWVSVTVRRQLGSRFALALGSMAVIGLLGCGLVSADRTFAKTPFSFWHRCYVVLETVDWPASSVVALVLAALAVLAWRKMPARVEDAPKARPRMWTLIGLAAAWPILAGATSGLDIGTASGLFNAIGVPTIDVGALGAKGDGSTDDGPALQKAQATGFNLSFQHKTYLSSLQLALGDGQSVQGNGGKILQSVQLIGSTSTNIAAGPASTDIVDSTGQSWKVGQFICVANGSGTPWIASTYDGGPAAGVAHKITRVQSNTPSSGQTTITVASAFSTAFPSGGQIYQVGYMLILTSGSVSNLTLDGNYSNQPVAVWGHWEFSGGFNFRLPSSGYPGRLTGCVAQNIYGEGVYDEAGGETFDCYVEHNAGNGVHLSGCNHPRVTYSHFSDNNRQPTAISHQMGNIGLSDTITNADISHNYTSGGLAGVASIDYANSDGVIGYNEIWNPTVVGIDMQGSGIADVSFRWSTSNNHIHGAPIGLRVGNVSTPLTITAATGNGANANVTFNAAADWVDGQSVTIWGALGNTALNGTFFVQHTSGNSYNLFWDAALSVPLVGTGTWTSGGSAASLPGDISSSNDHFYDCTTNSISLSVCRHVQINSPECSMPRSTASTTNVLVNDVIGGSWSGGLISGGGYGLRLQAGNGLSKDNDFGGGLVIRNQYFAGVYYDNNTMAGTSVAGLQNISVGPVTISAANDAMTSSSYVGANPASGNVFKASTVYAGKGTCAQCQGNGAIIVGNIFSGGTTNSVTASGGSSGNLVAFNVGTLIFADSGSAGANTFASNYDAGQSQTTSAGFTTRTGSNSTALISAFGPNSSCSIQIGPRGSGAFKISNHITGASSDTVTLGAACGSSPTNNSVGNDNFTLLKFTTGSGATSGTIATMPVATSYGSTPIGFIYGQDATSQAIPVVATLSGGTWTFTTSSALSPSTTYSFGFITFIPGNTTG